jgi:Tol biopolymer transport system component
MPRFSPDGKWIAYSSNASGRIEVYVTPFPHPEGKWQLSSAGGSAPRWRRDGKELFYVSADRTLMAVDVRAGSSVEGGVPVPLFSPRFVNVYFYDVSADGQRFLVNTELPEEPFPLTLVVNWTAGLER